MKNKKLNKITFVSLSLFIFALSFFILTSWSRADDDNESDNEHENRSSDERTISPVVSPVIKPIVSPVPVVDQLPQPAVVNIVSPVAAPIIRETKTINSVKTIIRTETISDSKAILESLKDSDGDGIPDVIDKHPGEDDFAYAFLDANGNGIADDLEVLIN